MTVRFISHQSGEGFKEHSLFYTEPTKLGSPSVDKEHIYQGEWHLHPEKYNLSSLLLDVVFPSETEQPCLGQEAVAHNWPHNLLYTVSHPPLLQQINLHSRALKESARS